MNLGPAGFALLAWMLAVPAPTPELTPVLTFDHGRATLVARQVPVSRVLEAWERVGKTSIDIRGDLPAVSVDLTITDMPERQVLERLLQGAAGVVLVRRSQPDGAGSAYARIRVLGQNWAGSAERPLTDRSSPAGSSPEALFDYPAPVTSSDAAADDEVLRILGTMGGAGSVPSTSAEIPEIRFTYAGTSVGPVDPGDLPIVERAPADGTSVRPPPAPSVPPEAAFDYPRPGVLPSCLPGQIAGSPLSGVPGCWTPVPTPVSAPGAQPGKSPSRQ